jgi:amino acid adenylation domain-containing protein
MERIDIQSAQPTPLRMTSAPGARPGRAATAPASSPAGALSDAKRALRERRLRGEGAGGVKAPVIPPRPADAPVPLSFAQQRLWFFHQLEPASPLYNMPLALRLRGPLEPAALREAIAAIVRRHEILRTRFVAASGEPRQVIDPPGPLELPLEELSADGTEEMEPRLQRRITAESEQPFDLARDRLLRARLFRLGEADHVLLLVAHHIVGDGWSWGVFMHELTVLYPGFNHGNAAVLPGLSLQYGDYAVWQRGQLDGGTMARLLAYWRQQLAAAPEALDLPTDWPRPAMQTFPGRWETRPLGPALSQSVQALSRHEGVTLFMTLLAAYGILLSRYAQQTDVIVAAPIAGRTLVETEKLIGFFVNTLALRLDLSGNPSFRELLRRAQATALEAFAHQDLPFEKLVEELHPNRRANRLPLAQVAFVLQNTPAQLPQLPGLEVTQVPSWTRTAKFDLTLCVDETAEGLVAALEYNTALFAPATAVRLLESFHVLLEAIVAAPERRIADLPLLSPGASEQLLRQWNDTARPYPRDATVHALFERRVQLAPSAPAVIFEEQVLTYQELNARANRLAHRLRRLGIGPDKLVALCLDRTPEMIVAVLAILKAGGGYVSLDPAFPRERLAYMLADSGAAVIVTTEERRTLLPAPASLVATADGPDQKSDAPRLLSLDAERREIERESQANPPPLAEAEHLAYVSYTSGSTGRPKGVCISHRAVNRLLINTDFIELGPEDGVLQIANCAFDASTFEIWGALLNGARLVIVPPEVVLTPARLAREIASHGVTTGFFTTALFNQLARHAPGIFRGMRHVLFGGEASNPECVRRVLARDRPARLLHVYGPTETTTFATWFEVRDVPDGTTTIPIGRPLANTTVYVLDQDRRPVPIGVAGELYIGGEGVARGYLHQPELTAQKFVPDPFGAEPGAHLYRTGDRVRWLNSGVLEFIGRFDRQVKIRGFRIELEEVETALVRHPAVKEAVVVVHPTEDDERRLTAYIGAGGPPPPVGELRAHLQRSLPDHMIPAAFVLLDALPLNANGKVDRAALPPPDDRAAAAARTFAPPRDELEQRLVGIWERVLDVRPVGIHDNFFELGGHSLAGVRLFAGIEQEFGRTLPLASLFAGPTIAELAQRLQPRAPVPVAGSLVTLQAGGTRTPLFFVHGAGAGNLWMYANLVPHLGSDQPVYAFESRPGGEDGEPTRIEDMAARYVREMRAVQPHGPYLLSGYCFGGNVAYEMACQLEAAGEPIGLLVLLDSAPPGGSYYRLPWWRPEFALRFAANTAYWLGDFFAQDPAARRSLVRRKLRSGTRRLREWLRRGRRHPAGVDLEAVIDVSLFPRSELQVWQAHVHAAWSHRPKHYRGRVTLLRTRGHPFLCSFDPECGWGELAGGGVELILTPGAHEKIFLEPHVRVLAARLRALIQSGWESPRA